jgi:predicted amidohydrolase
MDKTTARRTVIGAAAAIPVAAQAATRTPSLPQRMSDAAITPWVATCIQTPQAILGAAKSRDEARAILAKDMERFDRQVSNASERRSDLVLFPEYMLGGPESDLKGVLDFPGPEIERVQTMAQKYKTFVGGHCYTWDKYFPGRYFNTSFLIERAGDIVIRYYRIHTYHSSSPHDFWQRFLDKVGIEGAFPVARTELGNIAILPSMEFIFPEVTRMFTLRGAEVILHTTNEAIVDESVKRTRAVENMVFVMSANTPGPVGRKSMRVGSRIVDWEGEVLARVADGEEGQCTSVLDVEGLRRRRSDPDIVGPAPRGFLNVNYLSRLRVEICSEVYNTASFYPPDTYQEGTATKTNITPEINAGRLKTGLKQMVDGGLIPKKYVGT